MIPKHIPVACLQNGVENEALVAATHDTIAAMVWIMAVHLAPGEVALYASKCLGILDIGTLSGEPLVAQELAELFCRAGFDSALRQDIMPWKRAKLLGNLAGIFEIAIDGYDAKRAQALVAEGCAVLTKAKLPWTPMERFGERVKKAEHVPIQGKNRPGGSLWQSKQRGSVSEAEYLNGYITRLGAMVGIPTPVNSQLLAQAKD
jgi:ketopantoate reductase